MYPLGHSSEETSTSREVGIRGCESCHNIDSWSQNFYMKSVGERNRRKDGESVELILVKKEGG